MCIMVSLLLAPEDLGYIIRALESQLLFVEWQLKRTMGREHSASAAELAVEAADLRRLREKLEPGRLTSKGHRPKKIRAAG